nr:PREDICTED: L-aminoadipate-semialdehyde dehydrogenase-phosphopantetheinyl transferase [Apteryx mantelli mantelli]
MAPLKSLLRPLWHPPSSRFDASPRLGSSYRRALVQLLIQMSKLLTAGRLLIRKLIAEKLHIPWNEICLQRTSKGKPFLANNMSSTCSNYNFNVSHQGDYAVLAAEPELQVGIDIMKTSLPVAQYLSTGRLFYLVFIIPLDSGSSSIPNFFRIMKRQFTEAEWGVIKSMNNEWMQLDMFYRHWALKESFLKAIGVGIGFNLQRIEFNVSPLQLEIGKVYQETKLLLDGDEEEWTFEETRLDDNHHVAVALGKQEEYRQNHSHNFPLNLIASTCNSQEGPIISIRYIPWSLINHGLCY